VLRRYVDVPGPVPVYVTTCFTVYVDQRPINNCASICSIFVLCSGANAFLSRSPFRFLWTAAAAVVGNSMSSSPAAGCSVFKATSRHQTLNAAARRCVRCRSSSTLSAESGPTTKAAAAAEFQAWYLQHASPCPAQLSPVLVDNHG
jgi:hypothetical protein